jgi:sugar/nucleoside kinase (ribokinase family)
LIGGYGPRRLLAELGLLDLLLANADEARALCLGADQSELSSAARIVVVKQGADGASAFTPTDRWSAAPAPAVAVDTTGAGDAFDAAYLVEYLSNGDVEAALAAGNRLGAHVASYLGAQPARSSHPATSPDVPTPPRSAP